MTDISHIQDFLHCETPDAWVNAALDNLPILLVDHANCEKKAASTALNLMYRYVSDFELLNKMSRLAREELRHFEQVIAIIKKRKMPYPQLEASRYAAALREEVSKNEPQRLVDTLITGAIIEARSCERFAKIAPQLDEELQQFYLSLLKSEARHYQDYLHLAQKVAEQNIDSRVQDLLSKEKLLIQQPDAQFRFHSGVPA